MANHALPTTTSTYTNFVAELDGRLDDLAFGLDPAVTTATNVPTNATRWNSANKYWEKYNGTAWAAMSASYSININGSVGATTASTGAFTTLSTTGIASLAAGATVGGNAVVTVSDTQTLTNKTLTSPIISTISNTGTLALPTITDTIVGRTTTDTLTNKTLTAPKFADLGFIADINGNELVIFDSNASAVNEITVANAATGLIPTISATGTDANVSLNIVSKGTGTVQINGVAAVTISGTQTLTNKTLTTPVLSGTASGITAGAVGYLSGALSYGNGTVQRTVVNTDESQTLTNKTMSTGSTWSGTTIAVGAGGTGTATAPTQWGAIYASSASAYASTAAGTAGQFLTANTSAAPTWQSFDLSLHAPDSSYKKIVRLATTDDLGASTFSANVLTGYSNTLALALTTTAASTTITTTSTAGIKVGAVISTATVQVAAGTTIAAISNATTFTVNNRAAITTTAITGTGATATATFTAQTYAPYAVGSTIVVSGATPATYNGSFVVTACTTTSVSWASTETVTATVQGAINFTIAAGTSISTNFTQTIAALTVDGVAAVLNDRILVKDQQFLGSIQATDTAKYNGIYYVTAIGSTTVPWTLTRAADADAATDLDGAIVNVSVGTANAGKSFKTYFIGTSTLNTTPMYWNRFVDASASGLVGTPTTAVGIDIATDTKTQTLVTGAVTDLAINSLGITTVKAVGASTYTRASTLYIAGAPVASTNATITTPYSIYVAGGTSYFGGGVTASAINNTPIGSTTPSTGAFTTLSATGGIISTDVSGSGQTFAATTATVNNKAIRLANTGGNAYFGIESSTGGSFLTGSTAYSFVVNNVANTPIQFGTNNTLQATLSATGNLGLGVVPSAWVTLKGLQVGQSAAIYGDGGSVESGFTSNAYYNAGWKYTGTFAATKYTANSGGAAGHVWSTAPSGTAGTAITFTDRMVLDVSGNLGLGVTPSAWSSGYKSFDVQVSSALYSNAGGGQSGHVSNAYFNGTNWIYKTTNNAGRYEQNTIGGSHVWYTAPSGTAGNAITFTQAMTLDASGNLSVTGTSTAATATARTHLPTMAQVQDSTAHTLSSISGTNTITGSLTPAIAAYVTGQTFRFVSAGANTGAVTININSLGAKSITKSGTTALEAGDIPSGATVQIMYDGTRFQLTSGAGGGGATAGGVLYENGHTISASYTLSSGKSAHMVGPLTVASGQTLTIPTGESLIVFGASPSTNDTDVLIKGTQTFIGQKSFESQPTIVAPTSMVRVNTANGYGSTNTAIRRFTNIITNQGSDITYTDSATLGASFVINTTGVYAMSNDENVSANGSAGISLNTTQPTTTIASLTNSSERLTSETIGSANYTGQCSWTGYLPAGSVIRPHTAGTSAGIVANCQFTITRVA